MSSINYFNCKFLEKITFYYPKLYTKLHFAPQTIQMHVLHHKL